MAGEGIYESLTVSWRKQFGRQFRREIASGDAVLAGGHLFRRSCHYEAAAPVASSAPATSPGTAPSTAPAPLAPDIPATLSFDMAAVCHRFAAGHSIALQIQSSWFPLVAMNPQTFVPNPYTATAKDYRPVEVSILAGSNIILP